MPAPDSKDSDEHVQKIIDNLKSKEFKVRNESIKMLGRLRNAKARTKLMEIIEDSQFDTRLRTTAIDSLARGDSDAKIMHVLEKLVGDETQDREIRRACLTQLAKSKDPRLVTIFRKALTDEYRFNRVWAVRGLIKINDQNALVTLIPALGDEDEEIRKIVNGHLEYEGHKIIPDFIKAFENPEANKFLRYAIAGILGRLNTPEAIPPLIKALSDGNDRIVTIAIRGLSKNISPSSINPLLEVAKENEAKRRLVEDALFQIGQLETIPVVKSLLALAQEKESGLYAFVVAVLKKLIPKSQDALQDLLQDKAIADPVKGIIKKLSKEIQSE